MVEIFSQLYFVPITNMCDDQSPFDWSANEYGAKTCFPQSPRRYSPSQLRKRRGRFNEDRRFQYPMGFRPVESGHLFKTQTCGRQTPPPKSHITSTRTSLWFEGGCWGDGTAGRGGESSKGGRINMQDTGQVRGVHLSPRLPLSPKGTEDQVFFYPAASSDTAKFPRAPIVPSEVPTRRKPIPMTSTDEEEEERETTTERKSCSKRGGEGTRATGLRPTTDGGTGRRRWRQ